MAEAKLEVVVTGKNDLSGALKGASSEVDSFGKKLGEVGKIAGGFLAAQAVSTGVQKVVGFIGDSVSAASNLQQAVGGVNSVFKENADEVLEWGRNNAANFGLSQRAFAEMAGPLGAMLKNTGMDMGEVSGKTIDLTKRAADMAATFGGTATDALTAISAALRGETDPIERYGVSMSAAKVEAEAMAMTGKTVASTLTDQEKAAARLSLLFKQTADAEGQAAREADTHAGASARATAKMEDMQAQIGTKLLPITVKLTEAKLALISVIAEKVIPALEQLWAVHGPAVTKAFNDVVTFIETNWPKIEPIIALAIDNVITKIQGMIQTAEGIIQIVTGVVNTVKALFEGDWATAWDNMKLVAEGAVNLLLGTLRSLFGNIPDIIYGMMVDVGKAAGQLGEKIFDKVMEWLKKLPGEAASIAGQVANSLNPLQQASNLIGVDVNPFNAEGTRSWRGGLTWVGEQGPELVDVPQGSRIFNNGDSMAMAGGGGVAVNFFGPVSFGGGDAESTIELMTYSLERSLRRRGMAA